MASELDLTCIKIKWYTKFQINMSKHVEKKCGKLWRTDGQTDGQTHEMGVMWPQLMWPFFGQIMWLLKVFSRNDSYVTFVHNYVTLKTLFMWHSKLQDIYVTFSQNLCNFCLNLNLKWCDFFIIIAQSKITYGAVILLLVYGDISLSFIDKCPK